MVAVKSKTCNVARLTDVVQGHIKTATVESEISAEISYMLPFNESAKFEALFTEIENRMSELGVNSFGTSATTMEEVFLKYVYVLFYYVSILFSRSLMFSMCSFTQCNLFQTFCLLIYLVIV